MWILNSWILIKSDNKYIYNVIKGSYIKLLFFFSSKIPDKNIKQNRFQHQYKNASHANDHVTQDWSKGWWNLALALQDQIIF